MVQTSFTTCTLATPIFFEVVACVVCDYGSTGSIMCMPYSASYIFRVHMLARGYFTFWDNLGVQRSKYDMYRF